MFFYVIMITYILILIRKKIKNKKEKIKKEDRYLAF